MIQPSQQRTPQDLLPAIETMWALSGIKIRHIEDQFDPKLGAPVYTVEGKYTARGWTEWTHGFQYGSSVLQFDATNDEAFLSIGRQGTLNHMAPHVTHVGVHDHGFNNVSTYGNLLRLMHEGRIPQDDWEQRFYEMALMCSGAVQAARWTHLPANGGYIYSFNGPHSLFSDTVRSLRALVVAHQLGHVLKGENDASISLLDRTIQHLDASSEYNVYFGEGRDSYDESGRVVHESIFNLNDGQYRCASTQQGYSPFTTWTRGQAWILLGFAEQWECLKSMEQAAPGAIPNYDEVIRMLERTLRAVSDHYIATTPTCGIPYWDTGAGHLHRVADHQNRPADPFNGHEPVDSSAAAIAAQGLLRFGKILGDNEGARYFQMGLQVAATLLDTPYLSTEESHQGLLLHAVYHRPNGWDHEPDASGVPYGESCMWGDYHLRELALYIQRLASDAPYYTFFL